MIVVLFSQTVVLDRAAGIKIPGFDRVQFRVPANTHVGIVGVAFLWLVFESRDNIAIAEIPLSRRMHFHPVADAGPFADKPTQSLSGSAGGA